MDHITMDGLSALAYLLEGMDVPEQRRNDLEWLDRNLGIRNRNHRNYPVARRLIKAKLRRGDTR